MAGLSRKLGLGDGVVADDLSGAERLRDDDPAIHSSHGFRTEILPMAALVTPAGPIDVD